MSAPRLWDATAAGSHRLDETACAERFVRDVTITAASRLAPMSQVAVTTIERGSVADRSSSDRRCVDCESVGHSSGQGPGVNALATDRIVLVRDLENDQRWPVWADLARSHGFRSAAALPAQVVDGSIILLVGYSETGDAWDPSSLAAMARCAQELAHLLALSRRCAEQVQANAHLKSALASRGTIGQAMGIIMAQNRCSADTAFAILRSASQHRNLKLREVAASLTEAVCDAPSDSSAFREG
ncbi:MAG TPA: GAF and ANTAR domain-containing protein [Actinomycetes bacterium]|nr:GAF and ANTAR domain-containing protein [Actinomycetes bacterium]